MTITANQNACLPRCAEDHTIERADNDGSLRCRVYARPVVGEVVGETGRPVRAWAERSIAVGGAVAQRRVWLGIGELQMSISDARSYALELLRMVGDLAADEVATGISSQPGHSAVSGLFSQEKLAG